jgi:hypothetical protein
VNSLPISAEARGSYRVWRAATDRAFERIEEVLFGERFGELTGNFVKCKGKGRERAAVHLRRLAEGAGACFVERTPNRLRWAYLCTVDTGVFPLLMQVRRDDGGRHPWGIVFSTHALQRALMRSAPGLDLTALIWDGIDNARRISIEFLLSKTTADKFRIAAGDGAFGAGMALTEVWGGDREQPMITCETWLSRDQMTDLQEAAIVPEGRLGDRFDDAYEAFRREWKVPMVQRSRRELGRR